MLTKHAHSERERKKRENDKGFQQQKTPTESFVIKAGIQQQRSFHKFNCSIVIVISITIISYVDSVVVVVVVFVVVVIIIAYIIVVVDVAAFFPSSSSLYSISFHFFCKR